MEAFWKAMLYALWLLSQTLALALPALSSVAELQTPPCPAREQTGAAATTSSGLTCRTASTG